MPCRPAICSHSLGRAWVHDLPTKFDAAARYGFDIELFYEDLYFVAKALPGGVTDANQIRAAHLVRAMCDARGLKVISLQPFKDYDGLIDRAVHAERVAEMKLWFGLADILGTDMIGIASTFLPATQVSGDLDLIASDMREIADAGALAGMQFSYEALCWGTHVDTWEQTWEVVRRVNRPNFRICLDTFNIAGKVYADPAAASGKTACAEQEMQATLDRLVRTVDVRQIAYVQVVDCERLAAPLLPGHPLYDPEQPARMSWSRNCRLFYGEHDRGAYLPIHAILKAIIVDLGFDGYISAEVFSKDLVDPHPTAPEELAARAAISWQTMVEDFRLDAPPATVPLTIREPIADQPPRAQL